MKTNEERSASATNARAVGLSVYSAAIGSIRLGPFLDVADARTDRPARWGARRALSWPGSAGSSPIQVGQVSGPKTVGIRSCSSAQSSFGVVVTMAKLRSHSPAGERQGLPQAGQRHHASISQCYVADASC